MPRADGFAVLEHMKLPASESRAETKSKPPSKPPPFRMLSDQVSSACSAQSQAHPRRALLLFHAIEPRGIRPIWDCQCVRGRTPRNPGTRGEQKALVEIRCIFNRVNGVRGAGPAQHKVA